MTITGRIVSADGKITEKELSQHPERLFVKLFLLQF